MAPIRRSRRRTGTIAEPNVVLASPQLSQPENDSRAPRDGDHELNASPIVNNAQDNRLWTPEPEPYDEDAHTAWGRKHYGEDWYEQRELMFQERNLLKLDVKDDHIYLERQKALREMEREREEGKLLLDRGKTWQELMAWARMHYGEVWYAQRQALEQDERQRQEAVDRSDRGRKSKKVRKRWEIVREIQWDKDEEMLAQGKTWQEIMAWPPRPSDVISSVETGMGAGTVVMRSPSISSDDNSMISTYPPTPTDLRRAAKDGPDPIYPQKRYDSDVAWKEAMGSANWEGFEWRAVAWQWSEAEYDEAKKSKVEGLRRQRSLRENVESRRRDYDELAEIGVASQFLRGADREFQRERRIRDIDLRQRGWTQEDIDALDREIDTRRKEFRERKQKDMDTPWIPDKPKNQAQMNARFRAWDAAGLRREMQNEMARSYGFQERPPSLEGHTETEHAWVSQWKDWDEQPKQPVVPIPPPNQPRDHQEMNERFRIWDAFGISREEQVDLADLYGFSARPTGPDGHLESVVPSQPQTSTTKDSLRKSRGGGIAKPAPKRQRGRRRSQPRYSPSSSEVGRRRGTSNRLVDLGNNTSIEPPNKRPGRGHKVESKDVNAAEQPEAPKLRRSTRISEQKARQEREQAEQQDKAVPTSVDHSGSATTHVQKIALGKSKPRSRMVRGSAAVAPARGAPRSRVVSSKASKPQGVLKKGRPRKT